MPMMSQPDWNEMLAQSKLRNVCSNDVCDTIPCSFPVLCTFDESAHTQPQPSEAPTKEGAASAAELPEREWLAKFTLDACQIQLSTECM